MWHDSFLLLTCDMTHSYDWRVTWLIPTIDVSLTWLIHIWVAWLIPCDMDDSRRHSWLIHTCDMTSSLVWHDSFICVTCLIQKSDMTHLYVWHDSFLCVAWHIHMCDVPHSYVWHDSFICVTCLLHEPFVFARIACSIQGRVAETHRMS